MGWLRQRFVQQLILLLVSASAFFVLFKLNDWVMQWLEYSEQIHWIFLPAGLRITLVMVMGFPGAAGIVLGTWAVSWSDGQPWSVLMIGNGLISGLVPWLVLRWFVSFGASLASLKTASLFAMVVAYAVINALLHHVFWSFIQPAIEMSLTGFAAMAFGDLTGACLLLYLLKWLLDHWLSPQLKPH
jgi:hypothetical protein